MPWEVQKSGSKYVVIKKDTGAVVAAHKSKASADAHVRALYANTEEANA